MRLNWKIHAIGFAVALLVAPASWAQAVSSDASPSDAIHAVTDSPPQAAKPIRSRSELDTWLQQPHNDGTPFDRMPKGARLRFMAALRFNESGLIGFDPTDLGTSLAPADVRALLALFLSGPELDFWAGRIDSAALDSTQASIDAPISPIETRYNQLYLLNLELDGTPDFEHGRSLAARYAVLFASDTNASDGARLRTTSDNDLRMLYRAAALANFYAPDAVATEDMVRTLDEMDTRGIASRDEIAKARDALLVAHRFDAARRFTNEHASAHLPPLPQFQGADADLGDRPSLWQYDDANDTLTRVPVDLAPLQILVLAGCHFSVDAANDISADPTLGPLFRHHARWLSLPPGQEDPQAVRDWNHERPNAPMEMLYARSDWAMFSRWEMPTFYVVREGKVLGSVRGWAPSARDELTALLLRTGLMPSSEGR